MVRKSEKVIDIPLKFGGVSFDSGASVGILIDKAELDLELAERLLCGRRLDVKIKAIPPGEDPNQKHFEGIDPAAEVDGSCDVNSYSSKPDGFSSRLHFNKKDVSADTLAMLAKCSGRMLIRGIEDIPAKEKSNGHADLPGQKTLEGHWRDESILSLSLGAGPEKALTDAGLKTLGKLSDSMRDDPTFGGVKGVGKAAAERINERMATWFADHPEAADQDDEAAEADDQEDE